jgi:uncharacterized protein (TIGR03435 family)
VTERFKLALHRTTKELPVYAIVVGKNGPKMVPAIQSGPYGMKSRLGGGHFTAENQSMAGLAGALSRLTGRRVFDRTGLSGGFRFVLEWTPDDNHDGATGLPTGPSLFTALQEQLGLRLESQKEPIEMLVIDSVQHPTED